MQEPWVNITGIYNRIPEKFIANLDNKVFYPNFFEKEFFDDNIEKLLGPILKIINSAAESWKVNSNQNEILQKTDKEVFAALIAVQYLRMPNIRDKYWFFFKKHSTERLKIIKSFFSNQFPENKDFIETIKMSFDEEYKPVDHSTIFSDAELISKLQDHILNKFWIFYVTGQDDFYTSDNPILLKPHLEHQPFFYDGFAKKGVEIIFPVGSSVLLTLWDKTHFQDKSFQDNKFSNIDDKPKRQYNCYQYIWSNDEVYSKREDFKLIENLKLANGGNEIFKERPKILVNGK